MEKDSKRKSASEALINAFGSYPIGYMIGVIVLPLSITWLEEDLFVANLAVTMVYAVASFVRTYYLRRAFEKFGFDDNFIRLIRKALARRRERRGRRLAGRA